MDSGDNEFATAVLAFVAPTFESFIRGLLRREAWQAPVRAKKNEGMI